MFVVGGQIGHTTMGRLVNWKVVVFTIFIVINTGWGLATIGRTISCCIVTTGQGALMWVIGVIIIVNVTGKRALCGRKQGLLTIASPLLFNVTLGGLFMGVTASGTCYLVFWVLQLDFGLFFLIFGGHLYFVKNTSVPRFTRNIRVGKRVVGFALVIYRETINMAIGFTGQICGLPRATIAYIGGVYTMFVGVCIFYSFAVGITTRVITLFGRWTFFSIFYYIVYGCDNGGSTTRWGVVVFFRCNASQWGFVRVCYAVVFPGGPCVLCRWWFFWLVGFFISGNE